MIRWKSHCLIFSFCASLSLPAYGFLKSPLEKAYEQRSQLLAQLADIETQEGQVALSLRHTKKAIRKNNRAQKKLKKKQTSLREQIKKTIITINHLLQVSYVWLQQPKLKWLLSNESHETLHELNHYQERIESTRETEIQRLRFLESTLLKNQEDLEEKASQLHTLLLQQRKSLQTLKETEASRHKVIDHLDDIIREERLKNEPDDAPDVWNNDNDTQDTFKPHSLPWPTRGWVDTFYGQTYQNTYLKQHGIVIRGHKGQAVRAIADGDVVFAKWLPGYGHLMIINHHNGYLSLYGRNRYLEKMLGDHVDAGEEIASLGDSGGYARPGLYFELRYLANPVNPLAWLKPNSQHHARRQHDSSQLNRHSRWHHPKS